MINNFSGTCDRPSSEWDLEWISQREGESIREYIQRFCQKQNTITDIDERAVIMYIKKGLRDRELFCVLVRKDPRTCEELFEIANPYANAEDALTETRGERRSGHREKGESSKPGDRRKKSDREVANIERPPSPKLAEYRTHRVKPTEYADFLERKCVIHP